MATSDVVLREQRVAPAADQEAAFEWIGASNGGQLTGVAASVGVWGANKGGFQGREAIRKRARVVLTYVNKAQWGLPKTADISIQLETPSGELSPETGGKDEGCTRLTSRKTPETIIGPRKTVVFRTSYFRTISKLYSRLPSRPPIPGNRRQILHGRPSFDFHPREIRNELALIETNGLVEDLPLSLVWRVTRKGAQDGIDPYARYPGELEHYLRNLYTSLEASRQVNKFKG
ncbi:hypothetical protein C8J57DRAFT_1233802 [Mycena rebaudengoi]|nr:hypothetical protein C8J57DRAFT_1233802 [Mycena rebaudengoi]